MRVALFRRQSGPSAPDPGNVGVPSTYNPQAAPVAGFAVPFGPQTPPFDPLAAVLPPTAGPPVPVRLRVPEPSGRSGDWLKGTLRVSPGILVWVPEAGLPAVPVDLARAVIVNVIETGKRGGALRIIELDTPAGRVQLEQDPDLFAMTQEMVAL